MIPRDLLMSQAATYAGAPTGSEDDRLQRCVNLLAGRVLHVPGSPHGRVKYPRAPQITNLRAAVARHARRLGPHGSDILFALLTNPTRAYDLVAGTNGMRRIAVMSSIVTDELEAPSILIGTLTVPQHIRTWAAADLDLKVILSTDPDPWTPLEMTAAALDPPQRRYPDPELRRPPRVLWLGGSTDELPQDHRWIDRLEAVAAARGAVVHVLQQPARHYAEVMRQLNSFAGEVVVIWAPFACGKQIVFADAVNGAEVRLIKKPDLSDALDEFREILATEARNADSVAGTERLVVERDLPAAGAVRYYKKHWARRGGGDKMLDWHDCGCDRWTDNTYAPQAHEGIEKLERGSAITKLRKCKACTGGGVWEATF
ncbi:MAG: hypothetical protein QOH12_2950 [Solirubrobacteraceae bacterium]|jgi:hypothetical protein|nr:hypothetical protein [Solirubrobacteraceae bacterium]